MIPIRTAEAGHQLYDDHRQDRCPTYTVTTAEDCRVSIAGYGRDDHFDYTLSSSSPCVWENGTPA